VGDGRRDYDQAGCGKGCRNTMAGLGALVCLLVVLLVRLAQKGRRRG